MLAFFFSFLQIWLVCSIKLSSSSIVTPRYLYYFLIGIPSNSSSFNLYLFFKSPTFLIKMIPDFYSFSFIPFTVVHSFCTFMAVLKFSRPFPNATMSSAYAKINIIALIFIIIFKLESAIILKFVGELKEPCINPYPCFHSFPFYG